MNKPYYSEPNQTLYCGHALDVLKELQAESVDCAMTSPPYWGLRTYKTEPIVWGDNHCEHEWITETRRGMTGGTACKAIGGWAGGGVGQQTTFKTVSSDFCLHCNAWRGELGLEPTIELYISHLISIFNEVKRVLKKTGTCWVNLDDSYAGSGKASGQSIEQVTAKQASNFSSAHINLDSGMSTKSLCLIPQRFALAMVENGWILRNDIVWYKSNPMPESVKDRFTGSWEHLFFFVKSKKYWFEQQFEPAEMWGTRDRSNMRGGTDDPMLKHHGLENDTSPNGRNKRDVWLINTAPYPSHGEIRNFATFPEKLCETPILAGCPEDGVVLDPFCGSGTMLAVAKKLGRKGIGIELNQKYCDLTVKRLQEMPLSMELKI